MASPDNRSPLILEAKRQIASHEPGLGADTLEILGDMYGAGELYGTDSPQPIKINPKIGINIAEGSVVHKCIRDFSFKRTLEVGFGYGFSTVWILDALREQEGASHFAMDPFELSSWHGIGVKQTERLEGITHFTWKEEYSIHCLSEIIRKGEKFDFVYLCGAQRFDNSLLDFFLSDQILRPGGVIALDDIWLDAAKTVLSFITTNRSYEQITQPSKNIALLKKMNDDNRPWNHYAPFEVYPK